MLVLIVFSFLLLQFCNGDIINMSNENRGHRNMMDLTKKFDYPLEAHKIVTKDGYILTTYRTWQNKLINNQSKIPVLIGHGLGSCSEIFVSFGPERSLAFFLADKGFDVWLMNIRGTRHSRNHTTLNPDKDKKFWKFGLDKVGKYDIPANIDYITNLTKQKKIIYIGFSQGSTIFFMTAAGQPKYNDNILASIHFAPPVLRSNLKTTFPILYSAVQGYNTLKDLLIKNGIYEIFPKNEVVRQFMKSLCSMEILKAVCYQTLNLLGGTFSRSYDRALIVDFLEYVPCGAASMELFQYLQHMATGNFSYYDFGPEKNLKVYKSRYPPKYDLKLATAPVILLYGSYDWSNENEIEGLKNLLPNVVWDYPIPDKSFSHMDFILSEKIKSIVYDKMYEVIKTLI